MSNDITTLDDIDRKLVLATQGGLPLDAQPWERLAEQVGIPETLVRQRLSGMLERGVIRRIGAVPNHYAIGYAANGMSVWDVDDAQVDALGEAIGKLPFVTHAYRRPRYLPDWPYNLFAMVHGRDRSEVEAQIAQIAVVLGEACRARDVLYSSKILKKTGLRLST